MSAQINNSVRSTVEVESSGRSGKQYCTATSASTGNPKIQPTIRPAAERRRPPDRGIIPLAAKDRIGPKLWALYGKVDTPILLKDDRYIESGLNDFYRDSQGWAFLLVPYVAENDPSRASIADAAYRRAVALGITERPELFLSCLYHYQLPEYRCLAIHQDEPADVIEADKCLVMIEYERARLADQLAASRLAFDSSKKIKPVSVLNAETHSNNVIFALNTLYIHHHYDESSLTSLWQR
jgi:hypothetical protein